MAAPVNVETYGSDKIEELVLVDVYLCFWILFYNKAPVDPKKASAPSISCCLLSGQ